MQIHVENATMPKVVELTVEIGVQKVSCPGVWLCQDGRVSLTVVALGTDYQTCLLPPVFPLLFKDVFFFRKRFMATCAINNLSCLLTDEAIYCELVQWPVDCSTHPCKVLAQYLGNLDDVLFPPATCWSDGVDLLMKRTKDFPGILAPKIEICTKIRIDEVWQSPTDMQEPPAVPLKTCRCKHMRDGRDATEGLLEGRRQKQVCHSVNYHRHRGHSKNAPPLSSSPSRNFPLTSDVSKSMCSLPSYEDKSGRSRNGFCSSNYPIERYRSNSSGRYRTQNICNESRSPFNVYNAKLNTVDDLWNHAIVDDHPTTEFCDNDCLSSIKTLNYNRSCGKGSLIAEGSTMPSHRATKKSTERYPSPSNSRNMCRAGYRGNETMEMMSGLDDNINRTIIESLCMNVDEEDHRDARMQNNMTKLRMRPCDCEICRRYHELFHDDKVQT